MPQPPKKVYKFDIEGKLLAEYNSINEAARDNGITVVNVSSNCNGHTKSSQGFIYSFEPNIKIDMKRKIKHSSNNVECPICNSKLKISKKDGKFHLQKRN